MSSSSGESSPAACSPPAQDGQMENVACYEECSTTDDALVPSAAAIINTAVAAAAERARVSAAVETAAVMDGEEEEEEEASLQPVFGGTHGIPKSSSSGRITKRCEYLAQLVCFSRAHFARKHTHS